MESNYMEVSVNFENAYTMVAKAEGKINLETAVEYGTTIKDAILDYDGEIRKLILDFSQITFISSIGLKVIFEIYRELADKKGELQITGASDEVKKSFEMVGFSNFIAFE